MIKKIPLIFAFFFLSASLVYGGSLTLTTYYPAPFGAYDQLRLVPRDALTGTSCPIGTLYVNADNNNQLYYCSADDADGEWKAFSFGGIWTQTGDDIYLTDTTTPTAKRVGIGTGAATPIEFKLTIADDGGILAEGTYGSGSSLPTITGVGGWSAFIWHPRKAAFHVGYRGDHADTEVGEYSVMLGAGGQATGQKSTAVGGYYNYARADYSTVRGGENYVLLASAVYATMAGGGASCSDAPYSYMGGGSWNNCANGSCACSLTPPYAVLGGGYDNDVLDGPVAVAGYSTMIGGWGNQVDGDYATVGGGSNNDINANYATIGGGRDNLANGAYSTIGGGVGNRAPALYSTVAGGGDIAALPNTASGDYSTIAGGVRGTASGTFSFIGGGDTETASGNYSAVGGGRQNQATQTYAVVGGGQSNTASAQWSAIGGGMTNNVSGNYSFIGGGTTNTVSGQYSVIAGGQQNEVQSNHSFAGGRHMHLLLGADNTFLWGYSAVAVNVTRSNAFLIYSGNVGIGTNAPSSKFHVVGDVRIDNGSIMLPVAPDIAGAQVKIDGFNKIGLDMAEQFQTNEEVSVGDVVVMDHASADHVRVSDQPYDQKVLGIISTAPAVLLQGHQLQVSPKPSSLNTDHTAAVALSGRVACKVSLENGPIAAGDYLTTSSVPGHAMKAADRDKAFGAVIGKALEEFDGNSDGKETGIITVFITRQ